jgi:DNA-binding transcriptional MerR regulator
MARTYKVGEVAALTSVTVRTLHHYDRIGLLRPSGHTEGGHRVYAEADLLTLQQVLTLRYLGFSLAQIGELLRRPDFDVPASLRVQRRVVRDRIAELERIDDALAELIDGRSTDGRWSWEAVVRASATVQDGLSHGGTTMERMREYYTPDQLKQFEEVGREVGQDEIEEIQRLWPPLLAEVRANRHLEPTSAEAQALADRWKALTERTMAGYRSRPELMTAIGQNYQSGRFEGMEGVPSAEDFAFIRRVNEGRG